MLLIGKSIGQIPDLKGNYKVEKLVIIEINVCSNSNKTQSELQSGWGRFKGENNG